MVLPSMFAPERVTFAVWSFSATMLTVFVAEFPIMMGLSSEMSFSVPWDTFCPSLSATMVMSPSAMSHSLARADIGRLAASIRAARPDRMRLCFIEVGLLPVLEQFVFSIR